MATPEEKGHLTTIKNRLKQKKNIASPSIPIGEELGVVASSMINGDDETYQAIVKRNILAMDLSRQSTYVQLGIGGATGLLTGAMVGKVGKAMAAAVGGGILLINMGTRAGYITVDWQKVDEDMKSASERINDKIQEQQNNEETQETLKKGVQFVQKNLVMLGGFAAGFFMGLAS